MVLINVEVLDFSVLKRKSDSSDFTVTRTTAPLLYSIPCIFMLFALYGDIITVIYPSIIRITVKSLLWIPMSSLHDKYSRYFRKDKFSMIFSLERFHYWYKYCTFLTLKQVESYWYFLHHRVHKFLPHWYQ